MQQETWHRRALRRLGRGAIAAAAAAMLTVPADGADWPTAQQNVRRTGYVEEVIAPPYREAWRHDFGEMIDCRVQPIVAEGLVLVPTYKGRLHALDARTGEPRWVFQAEGPFFSSPAVADGRAFIGSQDRCVYAVNLRDGSQAWRVETDEGVWATPAVADGVVYIGSRDGRFRAIDAGSGELLWACDVGAPIASGAALDELLAFFAAEDVCAYAVDRATGMVAWKQPMVGQSAASYWPVVSDRHVYFRTMPVRSWGQHPHNERVDMQNPDRVARVLEHLERDPLSRSFFAFDRRTGQETVFPVLWTAGGGTVPYPPVVLPEGRLLTPAPAGERTRSSGSSSVSVVDEATRAATPGYIRVIADESYGYSASGPYAFSSHHDYLQYVDLRKDPDQARNTVTILGRRDGPVDTNAAQWFGNHDNHPGWHAASLADGRIYWINQGSWLFVFEGESR